MRQVTVSCDRCTAPHLYTLPDVIDQGSTVRFACLNVKRLPRVTSFRFDATKNAPHLYDDDAFVAPRFGSNGLETKVRRRNEINEPRMWLVYDFDAFFEEIAAAYVLGSFYPVATSCTTLAERLINLFIIKLRDLYPRDLLSPDLQSYVYSRDQNWQKSGPNLKVLAGWNLLRIDQRKWFEVLLDIRNRAVHFQTAFDPENDALEAIQTLHKILDSYFSSVKRIDIFRVFEIPGEIWVREDMINDAFVKAFVEPCCRSWAATGKMDADEQYFEGDAFVGAFSEEEFIQQRVGLSADAPSTFSSSLKTIVLEDGSTITYKFC